jgi:hypothetical protein
MILPGKMGLKDCFFDPIPQIIHDTESSRRLLLFSFLLYHSIYLEKQFEDSSEAFVDMEFELFGARKLHCRISFQLFIFRQYNFNSRRYRPTAFSARVKDEIRIRIRRHGPILSNAAHPNSSLYTSLIIAR